MFDGIMEMESYNFDYKNFLTENKLTQVSRKRNSLKEEVTVGKNGMFDWDNNRDFDSADIFQKLPDWIASDKEFIAYVSYITKYGEAPDPEELQDYMSWAGEDISWEKINAEFNSEEEGWLKNLKDQWRNKAIYSRGSTADSEISSEKGIDFDLDKPRNADQISNFDRKWKIWTDYLKALSDFPEEQEAARQRKTEDSKKTWDMLFGPNASF